MFLTTSSKAIKIKIPNFKKKTHYINDKHTNDQLFQAFNENELKATTMYLSKTCFLLAFKLEKIFILNNSFTSH